MTTTKSVLFVCLGNTCRSPIAEGVFLHLVKERGLESQWRVDSAATADYHVGSPPNSRALYTMRKHGINTYDNTARKIRGNDFLEFDFILGMDGYNILKLEEEVRSVKNATAKILLLGNFDPEGEIIIRDPYCDYNTEGFEKCYQQCVRSCKAFLDQHS